MKKPLILAYAFKDSIFSITPDDAWRLTHVNLAFGHVGKDGLLDSRLLDQYSAFALKSPAFRHGMKDPRAYQAYSSLTNASAGLCRGRSNFAFMDGHVQGAAYLEMTKWKPAYDITNYNLGFTDSRYDPFIRGFDPR